MIAVHVGGSAVDTQKWVGTRGPPGPISTDADRSSRSASAAPDQRIVEQVSLQNRFMNHPLSSPTFDEGRAEAIMRVPENDVKSADTAWYFQLSADVIGLMALGAGRAGMAGRRAVKNRAGGSLRPGIRTAAPS